MENYQSHLPVPASQALRAGKVALAFLQAAWWLGCVFLHPVGSGML
jgi:hypothetical protein